MNDKITIEAPIPDEMDERGIARKYGIRELQYPTSDQLRALIMFLDGAITTGKCGPVPKTAIVFMLEFLQATLNRQHITKGPRMSQEEFDILTAPYYIAARIISKILRERQEREPGRLYQQTYLSLNHFLELLRSLLDPGSYWLRMKTVPEGVLEVMVLLRDFAAAYPEQRRKGRAT
ncbi:MAG TPA: hypothetical protein VGF69_12395 [Thermoanaerobaculia bacterium]|jgi:hypothetical protein